MKYNIKQYGVLFGIFALSVSAAFAFHTNDMLKSFLAAPAVLSLFGAIFQLLRDQVEHEKGLELQSREMQFSIGTTSHMANKAFDKHTEFCEKYMAEINHTGRTLFREADTDQALEHAKSLWNVRQEYAIWLTNEMNDDLDKFEDAIRKLGANSRFIERTTGQADQTEKRTLKIDENFELLAGILGLDQNKELNEDFAVKAVKRKVRAILGVEELSRLRLRLVQDATHLLDS